MTTTAARRPDGRAVVPTVLIGMTLAAVVVLAVRPDGLAGELSYLAGFATATALTWVGVTRHPRPERGP